MRSPPVATVLQDILDQQPFSDVTLLEVGEEPGPGPCRVRASWCHDGVLPDSYRILLDGVVVLELEDAGTAREATVPVSGPGTACALVVGFAAGASLFDPGQLGSEGGFLGAGTQTCAWVRCDGSAACDPVPGPEKCTAGCRAPGGLRLCQIRHGSSNDNEVLATWTNGGTGTAAAAGASLVPTTTPISIGNANSATPPADVIVKK